MTDKTAEHSGPPGKKDCQVKQGDRPAMIVLDTVKGAGIKAIEDTVLNHHLNVKAEDADAYIAELQKSLE